MNEPATLPHPTLAGMELVDALRLIRSENVGPVTFFQLVSTFGSAGKALKALPDMARRGGRGKPIRACSEEDADREIEATEKFGARLVVYGSAEYPPLLLTIADPPPVITVFGGMPWKNPGREMVAVVGARNASAGGCQFAALLAAGLGEAGYSIVSGLARGIDASAHRGSLASGTVAVIAGGIDNIYPPENKELTHQIRTRGTIISEQPFGSLPFAGSFPGRNRIISGISQGTVVVEASPRSGSLITARLALEQNREVFAVPGSPLDPRSQGCNALIKDGAILTQTVEDVTQVLRNPPAIRPLREVRVWAFAGAPMEEMREAEVREAREIIAEKLSTYPVLVDELLAQCQVTPGVLQTALLEMELAGTLQRNPGNRVCLRSDEGSIRKSAVNE